MPPSTGRNFIKAGPLRLRWYKCADGRTQLDFRPFGRRLRSFTDHAEALRVGQKVLEEIAAGGLDAGELAKVDRLPYLQAVTHAKQRGMSFGDLVAEWSEARRACDHAGKTVAEVVAAGLSVLSMKENTVASVVAELLQSKAAHGLNRRYMRGLRKTGELLAGAFPGSIAKVSALDLEGLLDGAFDHTGARVGGLQDKRGRPVGPRRRNNVLREMRQIFRFAVTRGYLRADVPTEAAKVPAIRRVRPRIGLVSPAALRLYLKHCRADFLPWLCLNAFSGLRAEEIAMSKDAAPGKDCLRWEDFDWSAGEILVRSEVSKTGIARRCPILPNLSAWLQPWRDAKASGPVCVSRKAGKLARPDHERARFVRLARAESIELAREAGELVPVCVDYPRNGLRHSYCSFRIAITRNVEAVAYEAGDTPAMQKRHYNNPRAIAEAQAWFAIFPDCRPANLVTFAA